MLYLPLWPQHSVAPPRVVINVNGHLAAYNPLNYAYYVGDGNILNIESADLPRSAYHSMFRDCQDDRMKATQDAPLISHGMVSQV